MNRLIGLSGKKGAGKDLATKIIQIMDYHPEMSTGEIVENIGNSDYGFLKDAYKNKKFAYKLKKITCDLTGITMDKLEDPKYKGMTVSEFTGMDWTWDRGDDVVDYTFRDWLQLIGTDGMRNNIHPDIWVKSLFADYQPEVIQQLEDGLHEIYPKWIISDVRFPNEAEAIKERGGIVLRVNRPYKLKVGDKVISIHAEGTHVITEVLNQRSVKTDWSGENPRGQMKSDLTPVHLYDQHFSETALDNYSDFDYIIENDSTITVLVEKLKEALL